ncbi:MAG: hypothetical protein ACXWFW_14855, partial [Usitatibacter sp.]
LGASFRPTERVGPSRYFSGPNEEYAIRCVVDNQGQPVEAPGATFIPPPKSTSFFRVRGNPAQLYIDRSAKQEFAATDKALVSVVDNHATLATTTKLVGYLGYLWSMKEPAPQHGNRVELVPYIGVNRSVVEVREGSAVKPSASSNASAGVLGSFFVTTGDSASSVFGHLINVRPDFLGDHRDGSRILSLNLEYVPVKNGVVNSFVELSKDVASGKLIFSVKTNTGAYTDRGIDSVRESHRNFVRAGGQAGIALTSDNIRMPLDFSAAFTSLGAVAGGTSIDYFKSSLTYSFEANKYFGLSLVYSHGRREDTAKKEDQWEIGLSGRF